MNSRTRRLSFGLALGLISVGLAALGYHALSGREFDFRAFGHDFSLRAPALLVLALVLPLMAAADRFGLVDQSRWQRTLSLIARSLFVACLVLALSRPTVSHLNSRVSVVIAADASDSLTPAARGRERRFIELACAAASPPCALIEFGATARPLRAAAELDANAEPPDFRGQTDLQSAMQLAYGSFADGFARRLVLLSDGKQTRGDVEREAERAARLGIEVDHRLFDDPAPAEVAVRALRLPEIIEVGRPFRVEATLFANVPSEVEARLFEGDSQLPIETRALRLETGDTPLAFPALLRVSGPVSYRLELTVRSADHFAENNRARANGFARGRARVLWVDGDPSQLTAASDALQQHGFEVELRSPIALPRTAAELDGYDFFILSDVAADRLAPSSIESIERYVRDRGGGFMMVGGDHSFGLGGYQSTRLAKLLPVQMAGEVHRDDHSLALALLIDCSGSMAGSKIELAKEAARASVEVLADDDLIEVVGFAGEPERQVRMQSARNRLGVMQNIGRLIAQGGTQLFPALDLAYQDLALARARIKHVILLTDGQTQESGIPEIVQTMRSENITVSTVGLGRDVNRELLQSAAGMGGGRAYFTDDARNVPRIFVHETTSQKRNDAVEQPTRMHVRERADFMKGLDFADAPSLHGYVATQRKERPNQTLLESDSGEPLLARARVGLGFVLAFTPDLKPRWSADLLRWPEFGNFFAQLIREHLRKRESDELPMQVDVDGDVARVVVDAIDADRRFIHGMTSELTLLDRTGTALQTVPLTEAAPGRFEGSLSLPGVGAFSVRARHLLGGRAFGESRREIANPYPAEYAPRAADGALLARISARTGGRALRTASEVGRPARTAVTTREELWPYAVWLALALFFIDLILRRVRLFDRRFSAVNSSRR